MIRGEQEQEVDVNAPVVPPRGGGGAPDLGRRGQQGNQPMNFFRVPPQYKKGGNLTLYLRRFEAYLDNIQAGQGERVNLLVSFLDDETMAGIDRHLDDRENLTFGRLVELLRQEQGLDLPNKEKHIYELRNTRQEKNNIREFYVTLYTIAKRCYEYPNIRDHELREAFFEPNGLPGDQRQTTGAPGLWK